MKPSRTMNKGSVQTHTHNKKHKSKNKFYQTPIKENTIKIINLTKKQNLELTSLKKPNNPDQEHPKEDEFMQKLKKVQHNTNEIVTNWGF